MQKLEEYNQNHLAKLAAYNQNYDQHATDFDTTSLLKMEEFTQHTADKIQEYMSAYSMPNSPKCKKKCKTSTQAIWKN